MFTQQVLHQYRKLCTDASVFLLYTIQISEYILHFAGSIHLRMAIEAGGCWGAAHWLRRLVAKARGSSREGGRHCGDDGNRRRGIAGCPPYRLLTLMRAFVWGFARPVLLIRANTNAPAVE
jgi:hypothetical protein